MAAEDLSKYKDIFLSEAREHLASMNRALLELEKHPERMQLTSDILRAAHTLKSMAATMNCHKMAVLCHSMEDVLDAVKRKRIKPVGYVDTLFDCFDALELSTKAIAKGEEELDTDGLAKRLQKLATAGSAGGGSASKQALEVVPEKTQTIEVKVERLDSLMNLAEELLINKLRLDRIKEDIQKPELSAAVDAQGRLITELQYNVMQLRMVPIGFVFNRFPRMVRDLAKQQKKEVNLQMEGSDIELDRSVIDEIGESLVHLLRNAVDHGIETPKEREKAGKSRQGTIKLAVKRTKSSATIEVSDDGAGLNLEEIKNTAIRRGILSAEATREEVMNSVFSGVSTTKQVSAVSGRGLGLNIVKNKIESLGGAIKVESEPKSGTTFVMDIPLTLAIINTLFVEVGGKMYAIPLANIERLVTVNKEDIKGMLNYEALVLNEDEIPVTRLSMLFGTPLLSLEKQPTVIITRRDERLGLAVDAFGDIQEIVVKPLNKLVRENAYFSGCSIVGSGEVVLLLDLANVILSKKRLAV